MNAVVGALRVDLGWNAREFTTGVVDTQRTISSFAQEVARRFGEIEATIRRVGIGLTAGITAPFAALTVTSARASASFESAMGDVHAALRGIDPQQLEQLSVLARRLGPEMGKSAVEAAQGIETLALTGLSADQILRGAAEATMRLAVANDAALDPAAAALTDTMRQFGRTTADLPRIVNLITGALDQSKLGFEDFQQAISQAGGVAGNLGVSFEDFNTAVAATAPLFASGSDAGTSFKTFLQRLRPTSTDAQRVMEQLGLSFYDAGGRMKSMADIAGELRAKLGNLSEQSQNDALTILFGSDAMRTAIGLMRTGKQGFEDLQQTIGRTDAGEKLAIQLEGLTASTDRMGGAFERAKIALGTAGLLAVFTAATDGIAAMLNAFADLPPVVHTVFLAVGALAAAIGPLTLALLGIGRVLLPIILVRGAFGTMGLAVSALINPIGFLVLMLGRLALSLGGVSAVVGALGATLMRFAGWVGVVVTAISILYYALSGQTQASAEVRQATEAVSAAMAAYEEAALAAAAATGEARREALAAAAAKREESRQVMANARALLAEAQARLASARAQVTQAFALQAAPVDPEGGVVGVIGAGQVAGHRANVARADIAEIQDRLREGEAQFARTERIIAALTAAGSGTQTMDFSAPDRERQRRSSAEDIARRREELRLQQMLDVATARGDVEEERRVQRLMDFFRRKNEYLELGLNAQQAETAAARDLADLQTARLEGLARDNELAEFRQDLEAARIREDHEFIRLRENELFLAERITFWRRQELSLAEAQAQAAAELAQMEAARAEALERAVAAAERDRQLQLSELRGDSERAQRAHRRAAELHRRTREIYDRGEGTVTQDEAREQASLQLDEEDRARLQGDFRTTFREGVRAALEGDFGNWFERWWTERLSRSLEDALNSVADLLYRLFQQAMNQGGKGGEGDFFSMIASGIGSLFGGGGGLTPKPSGGSVTATGLKGFATGGSFEVGGKSGIDANLIQFRATKGEMVNIRRPGDTGGDERVTIVPSPYFDAVVEGHAVRVAAPMAGQAAVQGSALAQRSIYRRANRQFP